VTTPKFVNYIKKTTSKHPIDHFEAFDFKKGGHFQTAFNLDSFTVPETKQH